MSKKMRMALSKSLRDEQGQALIFALIMLAVGSLIVVPLLAFMSTGLMAAQTAEERMKGLYAADAGVEGALWNVKADVPELPDVSDPPWQYNITDDINGRQVAVELDSVWILEGLEDPIHGVLPHTELVVVGAVVDLDTGLYEVEVTYDGTIGNVRVDRIGVWLPVKPPPTFGYEEGSSLGMSGENPNIVSARGGIALIWDFQPAILFKTDEVTSKSQFFTMTGPVGKDPPGDFAWVRTTRHDIYLSWDGGNATYNVTATATDSGTGKQTGILARIFRDTTGVVGLVTWEASIQ